MSNPYYLNGYIKCKCGDSSPESEDEMAPMKWLLSHECGGKEAWELIVKQQSYFTHFLIKDG